MPVNGGSGSGSGSGSGTSSTTSDKSDPGPNTIGWEGVAGDTGPVGGASGNGGRPIGGGGVGGAGVEVEDPEKLRRRYVEYGPNGGYIESGPENGEGAGRIDPYYPERFPIRPETD